ncbi:protein TE21 [Testudinid alphaherpesvirus 3]|uniref:Protein TE21 n=1 Tax=Testudinid alphaherpesvirus 3 TaxID=2560801 RepID=A0A0M3LCZ2_9ALPH|nr:protein TE21 [Testudinid alphaherpesvirus 3]AIU39334.1 protein TE21 [Testudinid alphaherpesvirus 3]AIU39429.1 protein TE21 [Testudinid alphaherpesvirus 3]AKI81704.1 protein TE21 [Testudinid alphaherpesvirus 3]AKI81805.1 protein TE21 [Testudinid alphaherpesvirus 3]
MNNNYHRLAFVEGVADARSAYSYIEEIEDDYDFERDEPIAMRLLVHMHHHVPWFALSCMTHQRVRYIAMCLAAIWTVSVIICISSGRGTFCESICSFDFS